MMPVFCVLLEVLALDLFKFWQALLIFSAWRQKKGTDPSSTTAVLSSSWLQSSQELLRAQLLHI